MKIKCVKISFADDQEVTLGRATNLEAKLHVSLGKDYIVYGMQFSNLGSVEYLIQDDNYFPAFYPANLFEVIDTQLPYEEWHFGKFRALFVVKYFYIFGSKEMAADYDMHMSIILHDKEGLFHFEEWRKLIDKQYE
jgi:hypothetical protein